MKTRSIFDGGEIVLCDLSLERAEVIATILRNTPEYKKIACRIHAATDYERHLEEADAVVVISKDTLLADACATSIGNKVKKAEDIESAIAFGNSISGVLGIVIIMDDALGAWGDVELVKL